MVSELHCGRLLWTTQDTMSSLTKSTSRIKLPTPTGGQGTGVHMSSHRRANARSESGSESGHIQRHLCRNCAYRNLPNVVALGTNGLCHSIGTSCSTLAYRPVFPNVRHLTPCGGGMVFWGHRVKPTAHRRQWRPWFRRRRPCFPGLLVSGVAWRLKM